MIIVWYFVVIKMDANRFAVDVICHKIQETIDEVNQIESDLMVLEKLAGRLGRILWFISSDYRELLGKRSQKICVCLGWTNLIAVNAYVETSMLAPGDDINKNKWDQVMENVSAMQSSARSPKPLIAAIQHGKNEIVRILELPKEP